MPRRKSQGAAQAGFLFLQQVKDLVEGSLKQEATDGTAVAVFGLLPHSRAADIRMTKAGGEDRERTAHAAVRGRRKSMPNS